MDTTYLRCVTPSIKIYTIYNLSDSIIWTYLFLYNLNLSKQWQVLAFLFGSLQTVKVGSIFYLCTFILRNKVRNKKQQPTTMFGSYAIIKTNLRQAENNNLLATRRELQILQTDFLRNKMCPCFFVYKFCMCIFLITPIELIH